MKPKTTTVRISKSNLNLERNRTLNKSGDAGVCLAKSCHPPPWISMRGRYDILLFLRGSPPHLKEAILAPPGGPRGGPGLDVGLPTFIQNTQLFQNQGHKSHFTFTIVNIFITLILKISCSVETNIEITIFLS